MEGHEKAPGGARAGPLALSLQRLMRDMGKLWQQELQLLRVELREKSERAARGMVLLALGSALLGGGIALLLASAVLALALWLPPWLAALVLGGAVLASGLAGLWMARAQLAPAGLQPHRSLRSLEGLREGLLLRKRNVPPPAGALATGSASTGEAPP